MNICQGAWRGFFTLGDTRRRNERRKCLHRNVLLRLNTTQNFPRERGTLRCQRREKTGYVPLCRVVDISYSRIPYIGLLPFFLSGHRPCTALIQRLGGWFGAFKRPIGTLDIIQAHAGPKRPSNEPQSPPHPPSDGVTGGTFSAWLPATKPRSARSAVVTVGFCGPAVFEKILHSRPLPLWKVGPPLVKMIFDGLASCGPREIEV